MNLYLLVIWNDIEPELLGPFSTDEIRLDKAKHIHQSSGGKHALFRIGLEGTVGIETFSGKELDN